MRNRGQFILGGLVLFIGLISLLSVIFDIDFWAFCWPAGLILLGIWLLVRPKYSSLDSNVIIRPQLASQEIWVFVGDIDLDLTHADVPSGETKIKVYGFVGDVKLRAPQDVGVSVSSTSFITDANLWRENRDYFLTPVHRVSEGYQTAERKVQLEVMFFVVNLRVDQI